MNNNSHLLIISDLEGIIGYSNLTDNNNQSYLNKEISIALSVAKKYDYEKITVCNIHDDGKTVINIPDNKSITYISGINALVNSSWTYTETIMIGFHGREGSGGVFDHTFRKDIAKIEYNNTILGEVGMIFNLMQLYNIPVRFISGEGNFEDEVTTDVTIHKTMPFTNNIDDECSVFRKVLDESFNKCININRAVVNAPVVVTLAIDSYYEMMDRYAYYDINTKKVVFPTLKKFFYELNNFSKVLNATINSIILRNKDSILKIRNSYSFEIMEKAKSDSLIREIVSKPLYSITIRDLDALQVLFENLNFH